MQTPAEVLAAHRQLAAEYGHQPDQVVAEAQERARTHTAERTPEGARTSLRTDEKGNEHTVILPQVGARRSQEDGFEWRLEQDLTIDWASKFPKGSEFRIVGGENEADSDRLIKKWISVCPTFVYGGKMERPFSEDGRVLIHLDHQTTPTTVRGLCKIAFNYMALVKGPEFALSPSFDSMRAFIR